MNAPFKHHLTCPWCGKGEVLADGFGKLTISVQCPRCKNFYLGDLDTLRTTKTQPQRRLGRNRNNNHR